MPDEAAGGRSRARVKEHHRIEKRAALRRGTSKRSNNAMETGPGRSEFCVTHVPRNGTSYKYDTLDDGEKGHHIVVCEARALTSGTMAACHVFERPHRPDFGPGPRGVLVDLL